MVRSSNLDIVGDIVDMYVHLNFPEAYDAMKRAEKSDDSYTLDDFLADSMDEMVERMRAAAGML